MNKEELLTFLGSNPVAEIFYYVIEKDKTYTYCKFENCDEFSQTETEYIDNVKNEIELKSFSEIEEVNDFSAKIFVISKEFESEKLNLLNGIVTNINSPISNFSNTNFNFEKLNGQALRLTHGEQSIIILDQHSSIVACKTKRAQYLAIGDKRKLVPYQYPILRFNMDFDLIIEKDNVLVASITGARIIGLELYKDYNAANICKEIADINLCTNFSVVEKYILTASGKNKMVAFKTFVMDYYKNDIEKFKRDAEAYHITFDLDNKVVTNTKEDANNLTDYLCAKLLKHTLSGKNMHADNTKVID